MTKKFYWQIQQEKNTTHKKTINLDRVRSSNKPNKVFLSDFFSLALNKSFPRPQGGGAIGFVCQHHCQKPWQEFLAERIPHELTVIDIQTNLSASASGAVVQVKMYYIV